MRALSSCVVDLSIETPRLVVLFFGYLKKPRYLRLGGNGLLLKARDGLTHMIIGQSLSFTLAPLIGLFGLEAPFDKNRGLTMVYHQELIRRSVKREKLKYFDTAVSQIEGFGSFLHEPMNVNRVSPVASPLWEVCLDWSLSFGPAGVRFYLSPFPCQKYMIMSNKSIPLVATRVGAGELDLVNLVALAIGGFVSFSLLLWDLLCYLPEEIRLVKDFRKVNWRLPDPLAFILTRYSALGFAIVALFNLTLKTDSCQMVASLTQVFSIGVVAASGILTAKRTIAMWMNDCAVISLLSTFYVVMIGSWVATASQYRSVILPPPLPEFGTNCSLVQAPPWNPVNYGSSTFFFCLNFYLAMYRVVTQRTERVLNLGLTPLNRACIWYFLVNASTATALFIVSVNWRPQWTTTTAKQIAAPFFVLLLTAMSQRIYLNNQADSTLRTRRVQELTSLTAFPQKSRSAGPRWSFVPTRKPVPSFPPAEPIIASYPRPPRPPPSVPISPLPEQHILTLQKSRTISVSSGESSSLGKSPKPSSISAEVSEVDPSSPSTHPVASPRSAASESLYSASGGGNGIMSPVSTIGFSSPPGSPGVLGIQGWPGKYMGGAKKGGRHRQTGSSFGSFAASASLPETPVQGLRRLPSVKSGWIG